MKSTVLSIVSLALLVTNPLFAEPNEEKTTQASTWIKESELPKGFPNPGPFNEVVKKSYPAYRAATTETSGANRGFWTLFRHIQKNDISMTSPVEMTMAENKKGELEMAQMSFLYQNPEMGTAGAHGTKVQVATLPKREVLSYAWKGKRSDKLIAQARMLLLAEAKKQQLKGSSFRLLGYNSPSVPNSKKTHELQLILE